LIVFDYIERLIIWKELEDDILTQQELQEISGASNQAIRNAPSRKVQYENQQSGGRDTPFFSFLLQKSENGSKGKNQKIRY
jgi:hypothetical protein